MATLEYVLGEALKLSTLDQVKLISTLAHRVEERIRGGSVAGSADGALSPLSDDVGPGSPPAQL